MNRSQFKKVKVNDYLYAVEYLRYTVARVRVLEVNGDNEWFYVLDKKLHRISRRSFVFKTKEEAVKALKKNLKYSLKQNQKVYKRIWDEYSRLKNKLREVNKLI